MESIFIEIENKEQKKAITAFLKLINVSFKTKKEKKYDPEFVAKIQKSREDLKAGKGTVMTIEELNKLGK